MGILIEIVEKSSPPKVRLAIGMRTSLTRELTMAVKAPPTAIPMARSTMLPRLINSRNSLKKALSLALVLAFCIMIIF